MPKKLKPTVQFKVRISGELASTVKTLLLDPMTGRVRYGTMSELVTKLLEDWLSEVRQNPEMLHEQ